VSEAVEALRRTGNPYHLAHGLIDHAEVLNRSGESGSEDALTEASTLAEKLGCLPLLERAMAARDDPAIETRSPASVASPSSPSELIIPQPETQARRSF
jgi:hypothetical protein